MELLTQSRTGTDPPVSIAEPADSEPFRTVCTDLPMPEQIIRGIRQYASGNILVALWDFLEAASEDPRNPLNHYLCGLALQALGLNHEARDEWRKVLGLTGANLQDHSAPGDQSLPLSTCHWVRDMAQQLLARHATDHECQHATMH